MTESPDLTRRAFLTTLGAVGLAGAAACSPASAPAPQPVALRQSAVEAPVRAATLLVAYDVDVPARTGLEAVFRAVNTQIAGLSATVAVGASLFDHRYGLSTPRLLTPMPRFRADVLDPAWCHGDLLVQVTGDDPAALAAVLSRPAPGLQEKWRLPGFHPKSPDGAVRNLFGFREGAGNPPATSRALLDKLVWVQPGDDEPEWCVGGTYQVVRLIGLAMPAWDGETPVEHERVFGTAKGTGAPLGLAHETDRPDFTTDPDGRIIPLDAHIRRANPGETPRILRRGYSYRRDTEDGQIFVCYQRDIEQGFATVQRRLAGEALERYTLPFGGGYYFVLPGDEEFLGRSMLRSA